MTDIPQKGTILRAANGDVITYDQTGLLMHLSDRVIDDIAARLDLPALQPMTQDAVILPDDIDAWDVRMQGDWFFFTGNLFGAEGVRGYQRHRDHPTILAQSHLPLIGILAIGGARAALATAGPARFPYHLMAPADDIGAVGLAGLEAAIPTPLLEPLRELTHEAMLAETLLAKRAERGMGLPIFCLRAETDMAAAAHELGQGPAVENLEAAMRNIVAAAARLGRRATLPVICLDYCLEDVTGDPIAYRDGILAMMERLTVSLGELGLPAPVFLSGFDCGTQTITTGPALEGQWELSWNNAAHKVLFTCPSYAFELDDTGRLTDRGRRQKAEISAEALLAHEAGERWICPTLQLAEYDGDVIRITVAAGERLVLDKGDPFGAGKAAGFRLTGTKATIQSVEIASNDPRSVILRLSGRPEGEVYVTYAYGAPAGKGPYPANAGALRDEWQAKDRPLHRWALPARLKVTGL
jgi:hypothetical protein